MYCRANNGRTFGGGHTLCVPGSGKGCFTTVRSGWVDPVTGGTVNVLGGASGRPSTSIRSPCGEWHEHAIALAQ